MSITPLNIGSAANDGTGQDLRSGGQVINENFAELDQRAATAQATADAKVDKETGKGLSTEDFTPGEKAKLAGLQPAHYRGTFTTIEALQAGVATPIAGDYADVDAGVGSDVQRYIWDATDAHWVLQGATGGGPDNTDSLPEGTTNLYFTAARVRSVVLSGLSLLSGAAVVAADSFLVAIGKLQKQISDLAVSVTNKANKGANGDITSLSGLTVPLSEAQGGTGYSSGVPNMAGASTTVAGIKGLVPAPSAGPTRFLSSLGTWLTLNASAAWGGITGNILDQSDLQGALDATKMKRWRSGNLSVSGSVTNLAHGLGQAPDDGTIFVTLTAATGGWPIGSIFRFSICNPNFGGNGSYYGVMVANLTSSTYSINCGSTGIILNTTAGASVYLLPANCTIQLELFAWN